MFYNVMTSNISNHKSLLMSPSLPIVPGALVVLDAHPGGIVFETLVSEYVDYCRTIYEGMFYFVIYNQI